MFEKAENVRDLERQLGTFMADHILPNEKRFYREAEELGPWKVYPVVEELSPSRAGLGYGIFSCPTARSAWG